MPFDPVHIDTWVPYKVATRGKYKYFLVLIDNNTRMTWSYLFQHKYDFHYTLKMFHKHEYVTYHFNLSVRTIRTDNVPGFTIIECKQFYSNNGILHQTSFSYRPQQNSRVERKHRPILEITRCLRFQSGLYLSFWGDCVMTVVHILNRLLTAVLNNKISFEILHNKSADYSNFKVSDLCC